MEKSFATDPNSPRGFTLIEVLIGLLIVSVILMASMRSLSVSADTHRRLDLKTMAAWVAEDQVALIRAQGQIMPDAPTSGEVTQGGDVFKWQWTVEDAPDSPLRRVRVRVYGQNDPEVPLSEIAVFVLKR